MTVRLVNGGTRTATTASDGSYSFEDVTPGPHVVIETDPDGYRSTTPNAVPVEVVAGAQHVVNFGDVAESADATAIYGTVFDDRNVNGARDPGELGLPGATVAITGPFDVDPSPVITNEWGQYTFRIDNVGTYTVSETDPAGYVSTNAVPGHLAVTRVDSNTLRVEVADFETDFGENLFGDVLASQVITISGQVWDDSGNCNGCSANGQMDAGETGLAGARVTLSSGLAQTTSSDGLFLLYAPPNQAITVTEANPVGYVSTNAIPGNDATKTDIDTIVVDPLSGGSVSSGNLVGDILVGVDAILSGAV